jgi:hypothetical protein
VVVEEDRREYVEKPKMGKKVKWGSHVNAV